MFRSSLEIIAMGETTKVVTRIKSIRTTLHLYPFATRDDKKFTSFVEPINLSHFLFINAIVTTHGMYSHVRGTIPTNFMLVKLVVVDTHGTILVVMTIRNPTTIVFASTTLPLNRRRKPFDILRGSTIVVGIFAIPYIWSYQNPLNYFEYKKTYNPDVHVQIFEVSIKANGETLDEKTIMFFNFTFKDNASY